MTDEQWIITKQNCAPDEVEKEEIIEKENVKQKEQMNTVKSNNFILILAFLTMLIVSAVISISIIKYREGANQNTHTIIVGDTGGPK